MEEVKGSVADSIKSFVAGGFGGISAVLVGWSRRLSTCAELSAPKDNRST